jgi:hypothetical protein
MIRNVILALTSGAATLFASATTTFAQPDYPQWDPLYTTCSNVPQDSEVPGSWQVSAPRTPEPRGADVEVGLRNKFGVDAPFMVYVIVITPQGEFGEGEPRPIVGDEWLDHMYPSQFIGGSTSAVGPYTIVWQSDEGFIACDGFMIRP